MEYLGYYFICVFVLALFAIKASNKSAESEDDTLIYKYPMLLNITLVVCTLVLIGLYIFEMLSSNETLKLSGWQDIGGVLIIFLVNPVACLYFIYAQVILSKNIIIKKTLFSKKKINFKDVKKIVIYHSSGNPGAAMSKIYGDTKISLSALLCDYDGLINEITFRCGNAVVIDKQKK